MEEIKREHFVRDHPGQVYPAITRLTPEQSDHFRQLFATRLGLPPTADGLDVILQLAQTSRPIPGSVRHDDFNFQRLLQDLGVRSAERIMLNWRRFEELDQMALRDFSEFFGYFWYPGSDDVEVFDDGARWVVSISHYGSIGFNDFRGHK